jgi:hypothetical protein
MCKGSNTALVPTDFDSTEKGICLGDKGKANRIEQRVHEETPKLLFNAGKRRRLPGAVVEHGGELHLDVGAGADHQQHDDEEGVEVEERRLKSRQETAIRWAGRSAESVEGGDETRGGEGRGFRASPWRWLAGWPPC